VARVDALQFQIEGFGRAAPRAGEAAGIDMEEGQLALLEMDALRAGAQEQLLPDGRRQLVQHLVRQGFQQDGIVAIVPGCHGGLSAWSDVTDETMSHRARR
jgi:hypothetical protein